MKVRKPARSAIVAVVLLLGATAASARLGGTADREPAAPKGFRVSGQVAGLYPGRSATMQLRIRNPHPFPIRLRTVRATVDAPAPGCGAGTLQVGRVRSARVIPARKSIVLTAPVTMTLGAPDACMGARYPLHFTGKAVRA